MAEQITLRAYTERIENFLRLGRMDEAVAHATHVLQFYPKNADAYRNLGRALVRQQRYEEAGEIFRRLLAAIPDDFSAHYQLSLVYEQEKRDDAALWHIERAFDQEPNNTQVADRLRELYKKLRDVDVNKIQLTAGAVAKQYVRAGMAERAVDVLQKTLRRMPDRADLRLALASAMWENDAYVDAAEQAIEVLKTYPYALEANRILTELWLMEDRPSDAQRYLSRIEDIAPYLAYELATDDDVADEQFTLNELDYTRYQTSLASQEDVPDWLANVEQVEAPTQADSVDDATDDLLGDSEFETDEDWLADIDEISGNTPAPVSEQPKKVTDDLEGLLPDEFDFPDSAGTDDTVAEADMADLPTASTGMSDLLDNLDDDSNVIADESDEDLDDLFSDVDPGGDADLDALLGELDADEDVADSEMDDFLASLDDDEDTEDAIDVGTGMTDLLGNLGVSTDDLMDADEDELNDIIEGAGGMTNFVNALEKDDSQASNSILNMLDATDTLEDEDDVEDDLAWLEDVSSGVYDTNASAPVSDDLADADDDFFASLEDDDDDEAVADPTEQDPLAWLEDAGAEVVDEYAESTNELIEETGAISDLDEGTNAVNPDDPMAWLQESGIDFDETDGEASLFEPEDEPASFESQDVDPMAWLTEDDDDMLGLEDEDAPVTMDENPDDEDPDENPMAWLQEEDVELLDGDDDDDVDVYAVTSNFAQDDDAEPQDAIPSDDDMMAWLAPEDAEDFEPIDTDNLVTGNLGTVDEAEALEGIEFLDDTDDDDTIDGYEVADDEWLSDDEVLEDLLNIADLTNTDMNEAPDTGDLLYDDNTEMQDTMTDGFDPEWNPDDDFEADDDDSMAWLQDDDASTEDAVSAIEADFEADDDPMAWLQESGIEIEDEDDTDDDFSIGADDDAMAWLEDGGVEIEDEDDADDDFDDFDDAFDMTAELDNDGADDDALPAQPQTTGMLDFLSNADDDDTDDSEDFDFEFDDDDNELFDDGADWLRTLDGEEPAAEMPISEDDSTADDEDWNWGADEGDDSDDAFSFEEDSGEESAELDWTVDEGEEDAVAADADWLADLEAPDDDAGDADDFDDFDDFEGFDDEDVDAIAADADWLAELDEPADDAGDADDFDDFDDFEGFDDENVDEDAVAADADWLADLEAPEIDAGDADSFDDFDDFEGFDDEDVDEDAVAADADWLTELDEPADDEAFDDFEEEDEADELAVAEGDWLSDLEPETESPVEAVAEDFDSYDDFHDDDAVAQPAGEDWLSDLDMEAGDALEEPVDDFDIATEIEEDEPDWLGELDGGDMVDDDFEDFADEEDYEADDLEDAVAADADWLNELDGEDMIEQPAAEEDADWGELPATGFTDELDDSQEQDDDTDWGDIPATGFTGELDAEAGDDDTDWGDLPATGFTGELDAEAGDDDTDWGELPATGFTDELDDSQEDDGEWSDFADEDESDDVYEEDEAVAADANWLADIGVQEEDTWDEEDLLDSEYEEDYVEPATSGMTGMLNSIRANQGLDDDDMTIEEDDGFAVTGDAQEDMLGGFDDFDEFEDFEEDDALSEPDWMDGVEATDDTEDDFADDFGDYEDYADDDEEAVPLPEMEDIVDDEAFADDIPEFVAASAETVIPDEDGDYDEEVEQTAADNAPDWLNAMVPGLDLDFEAEDEGHLDEGFEERESTLRERRASESEIINSDFDWLRDIVEEESGFMEPMVDEEMAGTTPPPVPMPQRKTYEFSQLPAWAQNASDSDATMMTDTAVLADETPDYLSDFDDFEDFDDSLDYDEFDDSEFDDDEFEFDDSEFDDANFKED